MDEKLDLILIQLKELSQIVIAMRDRQDETDAKLEALAVDVHKLNGKVEALEEKLDAVTHELAEVKNELAEVKKEIADFREESGLQFSRFDRHMRAIDYDLDRTIQRVQRLEELRS